LKPNKTSLNSSKKNLNIYMVILEDQSFPIIWPSHPNFQSLSCKPSFKPYLSHHSNHKKFKMLNQPILIVCIAWSCLSWNSVFMLCYSFWYDGKERMYLVERNERVWTPKRQVTHILPPTFLIYALVFSVLCMIWDFQRSLWNA
jgi:hypothetical protein